MKEEVLFKKTPFGGFDRESVINYIQQLKKTQAEYKNIISDKDKAISELSADNSQLTQRAQRAEDTAEKLEKRLADAESEAKKLRARCEMLAEQKKESEDKRVAQETIEKCDKLVESAQAAADKLRKSAKTQAKKAARKLEKAKDDPEKAAKILQELIQELS